MSRVKASLIDKILRGQAIAVFLLKLLQSPGAYGEVIGAPVCEMVSMAFILSPDPNEVVEKRGKRTTVVSGFSPHQFSARKADIPAYPGNGDQRASDALYPSDL